MIKSPQEESFKSRYVLVNKLLQRDMLESVNERHNELNVSCRNLSPGHQNKNLLKFEKINSTYPILPRYVIKRWTFQVSYMPCLHIRA